MLSKARHYIPTNELLCTFYAIFSSHMDGYQSPLGTPTESTKGGVLLYVKTGINVVPRDDIANSLYKSKGVESRFIEIVDPCHTNSILGTMYRHPSMDEKLFNDKFMVALKEIREK